MLVALCAACSPSDMQAPPAPVDTGSATSSSGTPTTSTLPETEPVPGIPSRLGQRDFGFLYWPTNFRNPNGSFQTVRHVRTGHYGFALDVADGNFDALGVLEVPIGAADALVESSAVVSGLPAASVTYSVTVDGVAHDATGFAAVGGDVGNPSRLVDMGRFMQRLEIPEVTYASDSGLSGQLQWASGLAASEFYAPLFFSFH